MNDPKRQRNRSEATKEELIELVNMLKRLPPERKEAFMQKIARTGTDLKMRGKSDNTGRYRLSATNFSLGSKEILRRKDRRNRENWYSERNDG